MLKDKIILWVKRQVKEAGANGIVLGISGGIDSSVVAGLCKEAVGRERVSALILPCHSREEDLKDAKLIARKLKLKTKTIDLANIYDRLLEILPEANGVPPPTLGQGNPCGTESRPPTILSGRRDKLAAANLKPRLRMLTLYYFANKLNYLVCGTGNKSELNVGYFTKHGDGATDILPIGDLYKREVKIVARELNIPSRIITKPPSAGLWPGQTDEGEMGITYNELDNILERLENKNKQTAAKAKVRKVKRMVEASEHKRQGPRICYI